MDFFTSLGLRNPYASVLVSSGDAASASTPPSDVTVALLSSRYAPRTDVAALPHRGLLPALFAPSPHQPPPHCVMDDPRRAPRLARFLTCVVTHSRAFKSFHAAHAGLRQELHSDLRAFMEDVTRVRDAAAERATRARMAALKSNDMEAYAALVSSQHNERLKYLLDATDAYLRQITLLLKPSASSSSSSSGSSGSYYSVAHAVCEPLTRQPELLTGGVLKPYQLAGCEWLLSLYNNNLNGILADEMGLGKTVQTIALITELIQGKGRPGPYLVVLPLSTLSNWSSEFAKWAPSVEVVQYAGGVPARRAAAKKVAAGDMHVVLTTYDYSLRDKRVLSRVQWEYIIIDEGHRLKNAQSKLTAVLGQEYKSRHRLLLTGTPLQNSLPELWALLNFLLPHVFKSVDSFEDWFAAPFAAYEPGAVILSKEESMLVINRLHQVLRPFLLRRLKSQVLEQLPEKTEVVIRCDLSAWQRRLYGQIQAHGRVAVEPGSVGGRRGSRGLNNTIVQLRKVANHPYLFMDSYDVDDTIWRCSGKFELLDRMLFKLSATGHRVLIFAQQTQLLDILGDYMEWRGHTYLRLDGSTSADAREARMADFNRSDSPYFAFLLSTRAGGLGINLATADTVILFDSDWNPTADAQAAARAHRIGQTKEVRVFRLVTLTPVEERVMTRANDKASMETMVIEAGQFHSREEAEEASLLQSLDTTNAALGVESAAPDDDALNAMLARSAAELETFGAMDAARSLEEAGKYTHTADVRMDEVEEGASPALDAGASAAGPAMERVTYTSRLVTEEEVPAWVKVLDADMVTAGMGSHDAAMAEAAAALEEEVGGDARTKRRRRATTAGVTYTEEAVVYSGGEEAEVDDEEDDGWGSHSGKSTSSGRKRGRPAATCPD